MRRPRDVGAAVLEVHDARAEWGGRRCARWSAPPAWPSPQQCGVSGRPTSAAPPWWPAPRSVDLRQVVVPLRIVVRCWVLARRASSGVEMAIGAPVEFAVQADDVFSVASDIAREGRRRAGRAPGTQGRPGLLEFDLKRGPRRRGSAASRSEAVTLRAAAMASSSDRRFAVAVLHHGQLAGSRPRDLSSSSSVRPALVRKCRMRRPSVERSAMQFTYAKNCRSSQQSDQ